MIRYPHRLATGRVACGRTYVGPQRGTVAVPGGSVRRRDAAHGESSNYVASPSVQLATLIVDRVVLRSLAEAVDVPRSSKELEKRRISRVQSLF